MEKINPSLNFIIVEPHLTARTAVKRLQELAVNLCGEILDNSGFSELF